MKSYRTLIAGSLLATAMLAADAQAAEAPAAGKSIIDPKYRARKEPDWLANFITAECGKTKDKVTKTPVAGSDPPEFVETTTKVDDGIDTDKLFVLSAANGLTEKTKVLETQAASHGFAGRARMTVRNMLQAVAKQRHGLMNAGGTFVSAPADWLAAKEAPAEPTHEQNGTKKPKPVVEKPAEEAKTEG